MGFTGITGTGTIMVADNVDFSGTFPPTTTVTTDGQLLIGSTAAPHIRVGTLTSTGSTITITPGAGTIDLEAAGSIATSYVEDSGTAVPALGVLHINGTSAQGISTSGATNVVTVTASNATSTQKGVASFNATEFTVTAGAVASNPITVNGAGGITVTGSPVNLGGTLTVTAGATIPTTFTEDSGSAIPAANNLNILGTAAQGISTSGAGSTVTLTAANASAVQKGVASFNSTEFTVTAGAVASNPITLTAGTGITITGSPVNLGGTATISATAVGTVWNDIAVNTLGVSNSGYFCTAALTLTLPAAPSQGDIVWVVVDTTGSVVIAANTGQFIRISNSVSSSAGSATNTLRGDCVQLVYRAATTTWFAANGVGGGWNLA